MFYPRPLHFTPSMHRVLAQSPWALTLRGSCLAVLCCCCLAAVWVCHRVAWQRRTPAQVACAWACTVALTKEVGACAAHATLLPVLARPIAELHAALAAPAGPASYPVGTPESGFTRVSSTMTVPQYPKKLDGITYYIWTDIFFGDMGLGVMNQVLRVAWRHAAGSQRTTQCLAGTCSGCTA